MHPPHFERIPLWDVLCIYIMQERGTLKIVGESLFRTLLQILHLGWLHFLSLTLSHWFSVLFRPGKRLALAKPQTYFLETQMSHRSPRTDRSESLYTLKSDRIQVQRHENTRHRLFY